MKVSRLSVAGALFAAAAAAHAPVFAADSATVTVNASLAPACEMTTTSPSITLTLDPSGNATESSGSTSVSLWCTNGTNFTLAAADTVGSFKLKGTQPGQTDEIAYTVDALTGGKGTGIGSALDRTVTVRVPKANYANVAPGDYAGQFVVSVNF